MRQSGFFGTFRMKSMAADRSPCRGCDLEKEDKNNRVCMMCVDRIEYIKAIGGMTYSVPEEGVKEFAGLPVRQLASDPASPGKEEKTMTEKQEGYQAMQICKDLECESKGQPQPLDDFGIHAPSGNRLKICTSCFGRRIKEGHARRSKMVEKKPKPIVKKEVKMFSENTSEIIIPKDDEYVLTLDFSGFTEVLEKIQKIAKEQLRTPENQAIYWLKISAA